MNMTNEELEVMLSLVTKELLSAKAEIYKLERSSTQLSTHTAGKYSALMDAVMPIVDLQKLMKSLKAVSLAYMEKPDEIKKAVAHDLTDFDDE